MSEPVCQGCRERDAELATLRQRVTDLEAALRDIQAKLNRNSSNSSTPPSADPLDAPKRPAKKSAGRKPGGQPGHRPFLRVRLPEERITQRIDHQPTCCERCCAPLPQQPQPGDPEPSYHQIVDLPPVKATVLEHQGHSRTCPACAHVSHAAIPAAIKAHSIGPGLAALLAYLRTLKVSLRGIEELVEAVFDVPLALGTIARLEHQMSAALAVPQAEVITLVRAAPVKHVDETSWKQKGKLCWLWAAATSLYAAFVIHDKRGRPGFEALLGTDVHGILISDRWGVYRLIPAGRRQVCWAHLKRDFQKCVDVGGAAAEVGNKGLNAVKELFECWHLFRGGGTTRARLQDRVASIARRLKRALRQGQQCAPTKVATFCRNLLKLWRALWTFARVEGVEPTNNHAERVLRRGVLWRKCSFGSRSAAGSVFVSRMLTVVQTLRLQGRALLPWLTAALTAHRNGLPAPSLQPTG